jgi:hypothetical protein
MDLLSPVRQPLDPEVDKSAFQIDLEAQTATCPQGHTVPVQNIRQEQDRPVLHFVFPRHLYCASAGKGSVFETLMDDPQVSFIAMARATANNVRQWEALPERLFRPYQTRGTIIRT